MTYWEKQFVKVPDEVLRLLEALPNRLKLVVILRQGFDRQRPRTFAEVGRDFGLTRERMRQLYRAAINKLVKGGNELTVNIPLYSCECGKYQGLRYKGIWCDKCGTELTHRGYRKVDLL